MLFQRRNNQKNKNPDFLIFRESGFFYSFTYIRNKNIRLSPQVGFEPTTNRLTADRSTPELLRICYLSSMIPINNHFCLDVKNLYSVEKTIPQKIY